MSSGTSTDTASFRPWHLFVLVALVAATAAVLVVEPSEPVAAVLLTLAICAAGFVGLMFYRMIKPLIQKEFREKTVMVGSRSRAAVEREKTLVLRAIKELEFDRAMGKVSPTDFDEMGLKLRARAVRLMKQLDVGLVDYVALIERELQSRLVAEVETSIASKAPGGCLCENCQTLNDVDAQFCKECGKLIKPGSGDRATKGKNARLR